MTRLWASAFALSSALAFTSCSGGGSGTPPVSSNSGFPQTKTGGGATVYILNETQTAGQTLVMEYPTNATNNSLPTNTFSDSGSNILPCCFAMDAAGNIYVAFNNSGANALIAEYAAGAKGSVAPIRTIDSDARITSYMGIAVASDGSIVVSGNGPNCSPPAEVLVYEATATGNDAPIRTIAGSATTLYTASALAVDGYGDILTDGVSNSYQNDSALIAFTTTQNGNVAPARAIDPPQRTGNATSFSVGPTGLIAELNYPNINVFSVTANGNTPPAASFTSAAIVDNADSVAIDAAGNYWVLSDPQNSVVDVNEYASTSNGSVSPMFSFQAGGFGKNDFGQQIIVR